MIRRWSRNFAREVARGWRKFFTTPNFVDHVHAHFIGMCTFECQDAEPIFFNVSGFICILVLVPIGSLAANWRALSDRSYTDTLVASLATIDKGLGVLVLQCHAVEYQWFDIQQSVNQFCQIEITEKYKYICFVWLDYCNLMYKIMFKLRL